MDAGGAGRLNRSSPSCLNRPAQRTDFFHGLLADDGDGMRVSVRRGKTNQEGETKDVRFLEGRCRPFGAAENRATEDRVVRSRRRWRGCGSSRRPGPPASST